MKDYFKTKLENLNHWNLLKKKLSVAEHRPPFVSERDIWWAILGENVGSEVNGKSKMFSRPVIVFKKLSHGFYFVIPTTTQDKQGNWFVPFKHGGKSMNACLHQAKSIDHKRLSSKLGELDDEDVNRVRQGFTSLYLDSNKKYSPPIRRGRGKIPYVPPV